jgi:3-oxoacyl-[acyl-carrier protein] reductase
MSLKHVVVIGGSSSFGKVLVPILGSGNNKITSTFYSHKPEDFMESIVQEFLDLSSNSSQDNFATKVDLIDALILLPSILPGLSLDHYSDELSESVISLNFTFQANLIRRLLTKFTDDSQIIIMSSISAQRGSFDPFYAASKSALFGFGKSLAISLAPRTRTNIIAPSLISETSMYESMGDKQKETHLERSPLKRLLSSEELALVVSDLLKPNWRYLNGAIIGLNGGSYI